MQHPESEAAPSALLSRRNFLAGLAGASLAGCTTPTDALHNFQTAMSQPTDMPGLAPQRVDTMSTSSIRPRISIDKNVTRSDVMYAAMTDNGFALPEIPYQKIDPKWRRQIVVDPTGEAPGTIVVRLQEKFLYWVMPGGEAVRYGVGIGKDGFSWNGRAQIQYSKIWPTWTPPAEMVARKPELVKFASGQPGGLTNPLGARALYIFKDGRDTLYRVHGSPEWWSIGTAVSSGCVRLINQDIIDLYNRVNGQRVPIVVG
ncbi:L,D-transpeptidase [Limoniibacter endophyticus]|uniref:L,D-transpeptidase n=1 Tax=Limoniibacter endophyticus TaxID=1565040 RepID=A0A8J3DMH9_9HYPH|nr:L,D-transpeptidase [Limoniibacter endophyticus]GHC63857.1 L,D-transpeptidase [Limoniibacter endophyticus]